jgi:hypothetical protein
MAAAAANNNLPQQQQLPPPPAPPPPMMADNRQWRIVWSAPDEDDDEDIVSRFHTAWAIAVAPARIENDPEWLVPDRAFVWDTFTDEPDLQEMTVAWHNDGRIIRLSRV